MKIEIPFPCSVELNSMTPVKKGKFCASCDKVVIDFTKMTMNEIQDYFNEYQSQKTCGIFRTETISSQKYAIPLEIIQQNYRRSRNLFLLAFAVAFGFLIFSCDDQTLGEKETSHYNSNSDPSQQKLNINTEGMLNYEPKFEKNVLSETITTVGITVPNIEEDTTKTEQIIIGDIEPNILIGDTILPENIKPRCKPVKSIDSHSNITLGMPMKKGKAILINK